MGAAMPTATIDAALAELTDEFDILGDWEERYRYVIDLGRDLQPLSEAERTDANKVRGCASQVWLVTEPQKDGTLVFRGDSDAHIVRGLIAVLLRLFSGRKPARDRRFRRRGRLQDTWVLGRAVSAAIQRTGFDGGEDQARRGDRARLIPVWS